MTTPDLYYHESMAWRSGYSNVAGVDEAGRGPLAGPVVAAAVILPQGLKLEKIQDSKKMSEKARERAFSDMVKRGLSFSVGVVSHKYIDKNNILKASLEAMRRAVCGLGMRPDFLLVDGIHPVPINIPQKCVKKGDQNCKSISAASVVAKVYRDRIMLAYHRMFPCYGFDKNKGYGTVSHKQALKDFGPSPVHRTTFRGVL